VPKTFIPPPLLWSPSVSHNFCGFYEE